MSENWPIGTPVVSKVLPRMEGTVVAWRDNNLFVCNVNGQRILCSATYWQKA